MQRVLILIFALSFYIMAAAQDWKWKNPLPAGTQLNCVEFLDSLTAYSVGNFGIILKSTDGGRNWNIQESGTNLDLYSISAIDKDTVYVCGDGLNVFKTTNGGNSWENIFNKSWSNNTNCIFFVTPAVGYIAGDGTTLFKTTDYGATWNDLNVGLEFQQVSSIFFTSTDTGYASSRSVGKVLKTIDGGINWIEIDLPLNNQFNTVTFLNDSTGFLAGQGGTILKTMDAGNTWTIQNKFPSDVTNSKLLSVDFVNDSVGYIVGNKDILKTSNGGDKWELIAQSEFDLYSVSFADPAHGIAVGGDWLYEVSGILMSENGGLKWTEISSTKTGKYIDEVKFVNSDTGYAVGGHVSATYSGYVLKTTDAGETWSVLNTGKNTYWLTDIAIPGNDTIYVIAYEGQILKSTDAGLTWIEQNSNTSESLFAVHFFNSDLGYAVGENGAIIKTTDGGNTWINQVSLTDKDLHTLYFKNENEGFIATYDWNIDSTLLLTTMDGGENWLKKSIGTVRTPRKIYFVNNDTAFIAGDFGGILRTVDGGNSWEASYHNGNVYFDVFFTNNNTGYVVGEDGEISMTENCGESWSVLNSGTDKQLRSVFFTDVNTGYVVGSDGAILKTTNSGSRIKSLYQTDYFICQGDTILVKPNFIGGSKPLTYLWNTSQTSSSISVTPLYDTIYDVTIIDSEMDSINIQIPVHVNIIPAANIYQSGDTLISDILYGNQWYRNDSLINDATSNYLIVESDGNYYTVISDYQCFSKKSNAIQVDLSTTIPTITNSFKVYPNPFTDKLTIEIGNFSNPCYLKVIGTNGREYFNSRITENICQFDLNAIPQGLYLLQLSTAKKMITTKIIKK